MVVLVKSNQAKEEEIKVRTERYSDGEIKEKYQCYFSFPSLLNDKNTDKIIKHGWYASYHPNGEWHTQGIYEEGERQGVFLVYSENGTLKERSVFESGKLNGESLKRTDEGNIANGKFRNGARDGGWIWYHGGLNISGLRMAQGDFNNGMMDGRWIWFGDDGYPRVTGLFSNGTLKKLQYCCADGEPISFEWAEKYKEWAEKYKHDSEGIFEKYFKLPSFTEKDQKDHKSVWINSLVRADPWDMPPIPPPEAIDT